MPAVIAHIDGNNFYVACERVFNPRLVRKPMIVLSNNDGCVIARSDEAKALGIRMGGPIFKIEDLVSAHNMAVYSSNYALYGDMSQRLMGALQEFTPDVEVYSIDEAFMRLMDGGHALRDYGLKVRELVRRWTGLPVSIGIAPTKTLAKLANRTVKKDAPAQGVLDLMRLADQTSALEETPVGDVWGVGPACAKLLKEAGITTARKLRDADRRWIRQRMTVVGARIVEELRGALHGRAGATTETGRGRLLLPQGVRAEITGLRFHDLRHEYGSRLGDAGVNLKKIARLTGHSNTKQTERYVHPTDEGLTAATEVAARPCRTTIVPVILKRAS